MVLFKHFLNLLSNLSFELIVSDVQTQKGLVLFKGTEHLLDAWEIFAVRCQLVALQVQILKSVVNAQCFSELLGSLGTEAVTFKL